MKTTKHLIILCVFLATFLVGGIALALDAPALTVTVTGTTVSLSWSSVARATGYTLYYAPYPKASPIGNIPMGDRTSMSASLPDGSDFYVALQAYNGVGSSGYSNIERATVAQITPPLSTVKLIFIHHSTGGNWLANSNTDQPYGELGSTLMTNNYFVSATNYGWGPYSIGDSTDIPNWPEWFTGANSATILTALFNENDQNVGDFGSWSRLTTDPGGENKIIMFKSCFPNSDLFGEPTDPPSTEPNEQFTVSNAKAVYNNLLTYFQTRQDKLFIVITAPPQNRNDYASDYQTPDHRAANARAFNNWLINDWLKGYAYNNVAVFDYFNVLTATDNHHRWYNGAVQHVINTNYNFPAYPTGEWDSHPNTTGQLKATTEFVPLLNYYYNRFITATSSTLYVSSNGQCGDLDPCYSTIQAALDVAEAGTIIEVADGKYPGAPEWKIAGTVTISGGWTSTFTEQAGTTEMYAPLATGGGNVKLLPIIRVVAP